MKLTLIATVALVPFAYCSLSASASSGEAIASEPADSLSESEDLLTAPETRYQDLHKNLGVLLGEFSKNIESVLVEDGHEDILALAGKQMPTVTFHEIAYAPKVTVPYIQNVDSIHNAGFNMYKILGHALKVMFETDALTFPNDKAEDSIDSKFAVALRKELTDAGVTDAELENMVYALFNIKDNAQLSKQDFDAAIANYVQNFERNLLVYIRHVIADVVKGFATTFREIIDKPDSKAAEATRSVLLRVGDISDATYGLLQTPNVLGKRAGFFQSMMFNMSDTMLNFLFRNHPDAYAFVKLAIAVIQRANEIDPTYVDVFKQPTSLNIERSLRVLLQAFRESTA
ncbi:hypothetical protein BCR43DRAFT_518323 [Syncephalastrum racemosum]|uniref:EF-hand domain-containing protein n=1 Tax=Syncephalastrum racemosum TaxID=13706 RepID=A0A1X2H3M9_SYNRA|nr:hypothetical protein BCR43DRAFT_518323 [Syncephalastrum racemosum]